VQKDDFDTWVGLDGVGEDEAECCLGGFEGEVSDGCQQCGVHGLPVGGGSEVKEDHIRVLIKIVPGGRSQGG